jgi:hypothetical protein
VNFTETILKNELLASAPNKMRLKKMIGRYWLCDPLSIMLPDTGEVIRDGETMDGFVWRKYKGRYRFEVLL